MSDFQIQPTQNSNHSETSDTSSSVQSAYGEMYVTSLTMNLDVANNVYNLPNNTLIATHLNNVTYQDNIPRLIVGVAGTYEISLNMHTTNNSLSEFRLISLVYINNIPYAKIFTNQTHLVGGGGFGITNSTSTSGIVPLQIGDEISLRLQSNTNLTSLDINGLVLHLKKL